MFLPTDIDDWSVASRELLPGANWNMVKLCSPCTVAGTALWKLAENEGIRYSGSDWHHVTCNSKKYMMTSSDGNIFRITDALFGEFTDHRLIPLTKASDAEL